MYKITLESPTSNDTIEVTKEQLELVNDYISQLKAYEETVAIGFIDLGATEDGEIEIEEMLDEEGNLDTDLVREWLQYETDYCTWNDETGEDDNEFPFRLLLAGKYLVEFEVEQGDCVEASWDGRCWTANCINVKLISEI